MRLVVVCAFAAALAAVCGCNQLTAINNLLNPHPAAPQITFVQPAQAGSVAVGATVRIQWADVASDVGTTVKVEAIRSDAAGNVQETVVVADNIDAVADGQSDVFDFDTTGRSPGKYTFRLTITSPDGQSNMATSAVAITVQ